MAMEGVVLDPVPRVVHSPGWSGRGYSRYDTDELIATKVTHDSNERELRKQRGHSNLSNHDSNRQVPILPILPIPGTLLSFGVGFAGPVCWSAIQPRA
jgi:hypothetical protein